MFFTKPLASAVFQISPNVTIYKDLVFGWTVSTTNTTIVVSFAEKEQLELLTQAVNRTTLLEEFFKAVDERLKELSEKEESTKRNVVQVKASSLTDDKDAQSLLRRAEELRNLEQHIVKLFESNKDKVSLTSDMGSTPYAYIVRNSDGRYSVLDRAENHIKPGVTWGTIKEVSEVVGARWW